MAATELILVVFCVQTGCGDFAQPSLHTRDSMVRGVAKKKKNKENEIRTELRVERIRQSPSRVLVSPLIKYYFEAVFGFFFSPIIHTRNQLPKYSARSPRHRCAAADECNPV